MKHHTHNSSLKVFSRINVLMFLRQICANRFLAIGLSFCQNDFYVCASLDWAEAYCFLPVRPFVRPLTRYFDK